MVWFTGEAKKAQMTKAQIFLDRGCVRVYIIILMNLWKKLDKTKSSTIL